MVPVIVASAPTMDLSVSYTVTEVGKAAAQTAAANGSTIDVAALPGRTVSQGTLDASSAYRSLVDNMATPGTNGQYFATSLISLIRSSPVGWTQGEGGALIAKTASNVIDAYGNGIRAQVATFTSPMCHRAGTMSPSASSTVTSARGPAGADEGGHI